MSYYWANVFEWDTHKSHLCFEQLGFDFAYASRAFDDPHQVQKKDVRWDYGERRFQIMGRIDGRLYVVIFADRISKRRIISARKANLREVWVYENHPR